MTCAVLIVAALVAAPAERAEATASIEAVIRALNHARQQGDVNGAAGLFAPDADIWMNGSRVARGPAAVKELFVECPPWSQTTRPWIRTDSVRLLGPDVALVDAVAVRYGSVIVKSEIPITIVLRRQPAGWRIASFRTMCCSVISPSRLCGTGSPEAI